MPQTKARTNEEILKQAIKKAVGNGWNNHRYAHPISHKPMLNMAYWLGFERYFSIIFSQDFARSFWGKAKIYNQNVDYRWQVELQQMVLEPEPLRYLEKFL
jgi:hypothetical protein